jgi:hypothetical protein
LEPFLFSSLRSIELGIRAFRGTLRRAPGTAFNWWWKSSPGIAARGAKDRIVQQEVPVRTRLIHLINPRTDSLTTRPIYFNRALYSPLAGLLAVAACIPKNQYQVVLADENIETIDFDLKVDLVGISAMTSYVNRGYQTRIGSAPKACRW